MSLNWPLAAGVFSQRNTGEGRSWLGPAFSSSATTP